MQHHFCFVWLTVHMKRTGFGADNLNFTCPITVILPDTVNFSGKLYNIVPYGVKEETGTIDYEEVERLAKEHQPKMIVVGASAYAREIDFPAFRRIADQVGAVVMVDMAHIAGLVAAGVHPNPVPYAEFVTTTTHKTLRGPRGGMILCTEEWGKKLNSNIG